MSYSQTESPLYLYNLLTSVPFDHNVSDLGTKKERPMRAEREKIYEHKFIKQWGTSLQSNFPANKHSN